MLAWLLVLLSGASPAHRSQPPVAADFIVRAWNTADGLPQNSVTSIVQTRDGYLWLGTFGGLVRFDGRAFTVFEPGNTPGLTSARVVTLREDRRGVLWIGTETGLTKYESGRFTTYAVRDGLPHDTILQLLDDSRGRLWIGTASGLARFDGRTFDRLSLDPLPPIAQGLAETPDGDVWVSTPRGVARFHGTEPSAVVSREFGTSMLVDKKGRLWMGASNALARWDGFRFVEARLAGPAAAHGFVSPMALDGQGMLWINTQQGGVYRWRDGVADRFTAADGGGGGYVRSLLPDRDGNIWIGTDVGGLIRLKPRRVFNYPRPGVDQSIGPIVGDGADGLWIGATCGGLLHFRAGVYDPPVLPGCVWALLRDPDGTLWGGLSTSVGLQRLRGGRVTSYVHPDGQDYNLVTAIARDHEGVLWVGAQTGLSRFQDGRFTNVGRDEGLRQRVLCIVPDRAGALWVGTIAGLYRLAGGHLTRYTRADGLSHDSVRAIHEDADGALWIGTYGGGLNRFKDGRFTSFGVKEGLPDTAVSRIIEDPQGNLWMSGNKGIFRVARRQLNDVADGRAAYLTSVTYGTADGMIIDETNGGSPAGWRTPDGRLWFPTIRGLVGIEPVAAAAKPPPVVVERTVVNGRSIDGGALPPLGPGGVDAEFHYTAIDLATAEKTRFRYRLENYDGQWIDAGTRRVAYYTKLRPGRYHFEVIATNSDGAWSTTPARIAVMVIPFWWQRREVVAAGLVLLLTTTAVGVRFLSLRRVRARLAELEREQAVERERMRIARDLHDDLGSRLSHIAIMADGSSAGEGDERIAREARAAVQTMDELVWAVNARNDTIESLAYYIAQFAEPHIVAAGLRCRLLLPPDLGGRALGADVRRHLYLAVKEAINNAVKHAQASEIRVSLRVDRRALVVEVADDGRGLPAEVDPTGNGLKNFRERMDAAGGTVGVESAPRQGTRLVFKIPL